MIDREIDRVFKSFRAKTDPVMPDQEVKAKDGTMYRTGSTTETLGTLRHVVPKTKGKAARKADRLRRRLAREGVTA